jgi:outer membrane biosynthesis protein TonB
MSITNTQNKRKSLIITLVMMSLLIVGLFYIEMKQFETPKEYGIAVNFGNTDFGSSNQSSKSVKNKVNPKKVVKKAASKPIKQPSKTKKILTQENEEAIAIANKEKAKKEALEKQRAKEVLERQRVKEALEKKKREEEEKKKALDNLIGGVKNASQEDKSNQGNDAKSGLKGKETGKNNANQYYGNIDSGSDGDYNLGSRKPLSKPKPAYNCNEEGIVVVRIEVDKAGRVIKATAGVKGSTNTATCLTTKAEEAALATPFQADSESPAKQIGTIRYRFLLSK